MQNMQDELQKRVLKIITILRQATSEMVSTASLLITEKYGKDPFLILVSCLLSLRTKDTVTFSASCRLFDRARTPQDILKLPVKEIEKLIYPVGFYRKKAVQLHAVSAMLIDRFNGAVPSEEQDLLSLPGVGRKTMSLVLGEAFAIPAICVDTHVHRISNRLALVQTGTPQETETALKKIVPKEHWIEFGRLLVIWGQNVCVPQSPFCSRCAIANLCPRVGVTRKR